MNKYNQFILPALSLIVMPKSQPGILRYNMRHVNFHLLWLNQKIKRITKQNIRNKILIKKRKLAKEQSFQISSRKKTKQNKKTNEKIYNRSNKALTKLMSPMTCN